MDTRQLYTFLKCMTRGKKATVDVIPSNHLDNLTVRKFPAYIIVNSKPQGHPGEHWLAFHLYKDVGRLIIEFFCSYGKGLDYYSPSFRNFVDRLNGIVIENSVQLQSFGTNFCGHHVLHFLYMRMKGCCPMSVYCKFSTNTRLNDARVERFVKLKFNLFQGKCKIDKINQCCTNF